MSTRCTVPGGRRSVEVGVSAGASAALWEADILSASRRGQFALADVNERLGYRRNTVKRQKSGRSHIGEVNVLLYMYLHKVGTKGSIQDMRTDNVWL